MKYLVEKYTFDPDNCRVVVQDPMCQVCEKAIENLVLNQWLLITNVTRNDIMYMPQEEGYGGTVFSNFGIDLEYDCAGCEDTDILQIFLEVPNASSKHIMRRQLDEFQSIAMLLKKIEFHLSVLSGAGVVEGKDL